MHGKFRIETAEYGSAVYEGLRALWCETFGDTPGFVDAFYECFGEDIRGYAALDESGNVLSALTCYPAGSYEGVPVYVSYAICTRQDRRGEGIGGALTGHVRDEVVSRGCISIVSPAEESLEALYSGLGYFPAFHAAPRAVIAEDFEDELEEFEFDEEDDFDIVRPESDVRRTDASVYNRYREAYLADVPHIELTEKMLAAAELSGEGYYVINNGDAVCCVTDMSRGRLMLSELILSPVLLEISGEIDSEIAQLLAAHFDAFEVVYNTPGAGRVQSMAAGHMPEKEAGYALPYFGFPVE